MIVIVLRTEAWTHWLQEDILKLVSSLVSFEVGDYLLDSGRCERLLCHCVHQTRWHSVAHLKLIKFKGGVSSAYRGQPLDRQKCRGAVQEGKQLTLPTAYHERRLDIPWEEGEKKTEGDQFILDELCFIIYEFNIWAFWIYLWMSFIIFLVEHRVHILKTYTGANKNPAYIFLDWCSGKVYILCESMVFVNILIKPSNFHNHHHYRIYLCLAFLMTEWCKRLKWLQLL